MGRITKLQNHIGELQATLAEKNKLIKGFKAEAEQLTKACEALTEAHKETRAAAKIAMAAAK